MPSTVPIDELNRATPVDTIIVLSDESNQATPDNSSIDGYRFRCQCVATTPKSSRYIRVDDPPPAKPLKDRKRLLAKKMRGQ